MDWSKDKIIDTVKVLRQDAQTLTESDINDKYSEFKEKFPKLFYMALTPNFNVGHLEGLIDYRDKSSRDNVSDLERDIFIGEAFAKKYLYPVVGEPTIDQKKKAAKKVAEKYYAMKK